MYRRIVLPIDGSAAARVALAAGLELARVHGAEVIIVSVLYPRSIYPAPMGSPIPAEPAPEVLHELERALTEGRETATALGLRCWTELRRGSPAEEILAVAREEQADLILMPAHQHGLIASLLLGSVSHRILRDAPCPVQVIGARVIEASPQLRELAAEQRRRTAPLAEKVPLAIGGWEDQGLDYDLGTGD